MVVLSSSFLPLVTTHAHTTPSNIVQPLPSPNLSKAHTCHPFPSLRVFFGGMCWLGRGVWWVWRSVVERKPKGVCGHTCVHTLLATCFAHEGRAPRLCLPHFCSLNTLVVHVLWHTMRVVGRLDECCLIVLWCVGGHGLCTAETYASKHPVTSSCKRCAVVVDIL